MGATYMDFGSGSFYADGDGPLTQEQVDSVWRNLPTTGASWVDRGRLYAQQFDGARAFDLGPVAPGVKVRGFDVARSKSTSELEQESRALARGSAPGVQSLSDFERQFEAEFDRLDERHGGHNYVLLYDLRRALPGFSRSEFDAQLNDLRRRKIFSLDSADGRHVRLSQDQRDAGIREAGSLLVYAARR